MTRQHAIVSLEIAGLATLITTIILFSLALWQPMVARSQSASDEFIVTQTITGEISFSVAAADVTMNGSINGLTGGVATGTTQVVIQSNDADGYNMTLVFPYATTSGMQANNTASVINNYTPTSATVPDLNWADNAAGGAAEFGYSVSASTTADLALAYRNNGTVCGNSSGGDVYRKCWFNASITPATIINRTSGAAPNGATTTIRFKVAVPNNPSPSLDADTYTATATLTATNN